MTARGGTYLLVGTYTNDQRWEEYRGTYRDMWLTLRDLRSTYVYRHRSLLAVRRKADERVHVRYTVQKKYGRTTSGTQTFTDLDHLRAAWAMGWRPPGAEKIK